ncbi:hypothetical protein [Escherichia coli]|uniref:hypothetical protein n=1 Tax=Escherichia coli TaxID=562 RepID=UPI001CA649C7|nr:hypothetical protein [Escherichia coli]QZY67675.1 hypothetical protein K7X33_16405 [Escherichia coli]
MSIANYTACSYGKPYKVSFHLSDTLNFTYTIAPFRVTKTLLSLDDAFAQKMLELGDIEDVTLLKEFYFKERLDIQDPEYFFPKDK